MPTTIFASYPTDDLERSKAFYTAVGATINPRFTDDNAACLAWDDNIFTMVLKREFFATFTDKQVSQAATTAQFQIAFTRDSSSEHGQAQDYGFMYTRDLEDPDGNVVAFNYMVPEAAELGPEAYLAQQAQV
jgi:predicted lactoylglutathione lyase